MKAENVAQNARGEQVPSIPLPFDYFWLLPRYRCPECHAAFWASAGYRGHYALVHILGLP